MSDRSLDEFAAASAGGDDPDADEPPTDGTATEAEPISTADADPPVPTMRWSADGAACDDCGTVVSRRWADGDVFVCADCKEW